MFGFGFFQEHPRPEYETKLLQKKLKNKNITTENSNEVRAACSFHLWGICVCYVVIMFLSVSQRLQEALFGALNHPFELVGDGVVKCSPAVPLQGFEVMSFKVKQFA